MTILTLNTGSSSIKFALYQQSAALPRVLAGNVERIGSNAARLEYARDSDGDSRKSSMPIAAGDRDSAASSLLGWLQALPEFESITAVAHRVVHGLSHTAPELIGASLLADLHRIAAFDPEHAPGAIGMIEAVGKRHPRLTQAACFDTAFHRDMPRVAQLLTIPRDLQTDGLRRYGFHGLSYAFLMQELARIAGPVSAHGRVILAHLGNGASLAAVRDGRSIDTTMGFTPAAGMPMSSRAGDIDPGLVRFLQQTRNFDIEQFDQMINHQSGLLGISQTSSDMRDLLAHETSDVRAAEAVALFCYQAKKWIGAYAAVLGGLDTVVFAGGIGEKAAPVRARICAGLEFLGIDLDQDRNDAHADVISAPTSRVTVRVMRTDEELMMARSVWQLLGKMPGPPPGTSTG